MLPSRNVELVVSIDSVLTDAAAEVLPCDAASATKREHVDLIPLPASSPTSTIPPAVRVLPSPGSREIAHQPELLDSRRMAA